jgi:3-oxoacyl-[acyl-carrier-protein] synthase-1
LRPVALSDYTVTSAIGHGRAATLASLRAHRSGLQRRRFEPGAPDTWIGEVPGVDDVRVPATLARLDCRNNRLAWLGLQGDDFAGSVAAARMRHDARRIALVLGTSTSGILSAEQAYRRRDPASGALPPDFDYAGTLNTGSLAAFVGAALGLDGPSFVISTACSSSAKAFAAAARFIELGLADAAVVGGVDSLCLHTLYGFDALELLSPDVCRPWDAGRRGLSLGEAAAFALLERDAARPRAWLLGAGESSDGHHMSAPHPQGAGAADAIRAALASAGLAPGDVDYVNLHGTGTTGNDLAEDRAMGAVFGTGVACSSTKGATGHTLGAAGAVEAAVALLALEHGLMPGGAHRLAPDPALVSRYLDAPREAPLARVASNSFGFGGSNACLVFGAAP